MLGEAGSTHGVRCLVRLADLSHEDGVEDLLELGVAGLRQLAVRVVARLNGGLEFVPTERPVIRRHKPVDTIYQQTHKSESASSAAYQ